MNSDQLDQLIASAQSLNELATKLVEATKALQDQTPPVAGDGLTQADVDAVLAKVDDLKTALQALVVPPVA